MIKQETLHSSSSSRGDWSVVRTGMLAPESVQLFVSPFSRGRCGAEGPVKQSAGSRLFYLYLSREDAAEGGVRHIGGAALEILRHLKTRPKVFFIFVSGLEDLTGSAGDAVIRFLSKRYPCVVFRICRMDSAVLNAPEPPPVSIQKNLYGLLGKTALRDLGVNCMGNFEEIPSSCELSCFLEARCAGPLRHISRCKTFADYQEMAKSCFNLVISPSGISAAGDFKKKHGTPFLFLPVTYRLDEIEENYIKLAAALPGEAFFPFDFTPFRRKAEQAVAKARAQIGDLPVVIHASAVTKPFGLAQALLEYGFSVSRVESQGAISADLPHLEWLRARHPEVEILQPRHGSAVGKSRVPENSLFIGADEGYPCGSRWAAHLSADEGMFGFDGVVRLMERMTAAVK